MYKVLKANKDTYITNRVIKEQRVLNANVGCAATLDLFKLYGQTLSGSTPNLELSRLLIHFDLDPLRTLVDDGKLRTDNGSFSCTLKLHDVYGGQTTPNNFTVAVYPLSRSFDEGLGRDVVYYSDNDTSNFLTGSSTQGIWVISGCNSGGGLPGTVDFITASTSILGGQSLKVTQSFVSGEENLEIDVTTIVSATLASLIPDEGYRISFESTHEDDSYSYFVKRFAARSAFDASKRPKLIVKYDDSIIDDSLSFFIDSNSSLFFYNYNRQALSNLTSGSSSTSITGSNSLILKLQTEISGGRYELQFSGSQHKHGQLGFTGIYSASVFVSSSNSTITSKLISSSSVKFIPIWGSIDGTVGYFTGSAIYAHPPNRTAESFDSSKLTVSVTETKNSYSSDERCKLRINIFNANKPYVNLVKTFVETPGQVYRDVHWQIRNIGNNVVEIPFDTVKNSTRASSDSKGMFFILDTTSLTTERNYVIDIMVKTNGDEYIYNAASKPFKITDLQ
jgi:hypothetical protein